MSDWARAGVLGRSRMIVDVLRATHRRFVRDRMVDGAAGLAFYMLFSLIPMLLIFGAIINLLGADAAHNLVDLAGDEGASASLEGALEDALDTAVKSAPEGAGAIGLVGLGTLFYGASRSITAAGRALDVIVGRSVLARPLLRRAKDVGWTIVLLLLVGVLLGLVFVTGGLFGRLVELVGLGHVGTAVWDVLHWPVAFLVGMVVVALVVFTAPSERPRAFRPWTLGSLFSVLVFLTASAAYALYLANIANHNATYGAFAAVVILMLWAWMASMAFLFGAELDASSTRAAPASDLSAHRLQVGGECSPTQRGQRMSSANPCGSPDDAARCSGCGSQRNSRCTMYHRPSTCGTRHIESFFPERIQAIDNTDEPVEPRFPVELTREGGSASGTFARPFSRGPRHLGLTTAAVVKRSPVWQPASRGPRQLQRRDTTDQQTGHAHAPGVHIRRPGLAAHPASARFLPAP